MARPTASQQKRNPSTAAPTRIRRRQPVSTPDEWRQWWDMLKGHPDIQDDWCNARNRVLSNAAKVLPAYFASAVTQRNTEIQANAFTELEHGWADPCPKAIDLSPETLARCLTDCDITATNLAQDDQASAAWLLNTWLCQAAGWLLERYPRLHESCTAATTDHTTVLRKAIISVLATGSWDAGRATLPIPRKGPYSEPFGTLWQMHLQPRKPESERDSQRDFVGRLALQVSHVYMNRLQGEGQRMVIDLPRGCFDDEVRHAFKIALKTATDAGFVTRAVRASNRPRDVQRKLARYRGFRTWESDDEGLPRTGQIKRFLNALEQDGHSIEGDWSQSRETNEDNCVDARNLFRPKDVGLLKFLNMRPMLDQPPAIQVIAWDDGDIPF
jgi:hypothetical protein